MASLPTLPLELHFNISTYLPDIDHINVSQTCRRLREPYFEALTRVEANRLCSLHLNAAVSFTPLLIPNRRDLNVFITYASFRHIDNLFTKIHYRYKDDSTAQKVTRPVQVRLYLLGVAMQAVKIPSIRYLITLTAPNHRQILLMQWISSCWKHKFVSQSEDPDKTDAAYNAWRKGELGMDRTSHWRTHAYLILDCFIQAYGFKEPRKFPLPKEFLGPMSGLFLAEAIRNAEPSIVRILFDLGADPNNPNLHTYNDTSDGDIETTDITDIPGHMFKSRTHAPNTHGKLTPLVLLLEFVVSPEFISKDPYAGPDSDRIYGKCARILELLIAAGADLRSLTALKASLDPSTGLMGYYWQVDMAEWNPASSLVRVFDTRISVVRNLFINMALAILVKAGVRREVLEGLGGYERGISVYEDFDEDVYGMYLG